MCEAILELFADEYAQRKRELIEQLTREKEEEQAQVIEQVTEQVTERMTHQGIVALVETCLELGLSKEQALAKAAEKFGASLSDVQCYVEERL